MGVESISSGGSCLTIAIGKGKSMGVGGGGATGSTGVELTTVLLGFLVKTLEDGEMFRGVTGESGGG